MITMTEVGTGEPGLPPAITITVVGIVDLERMQRVFNRALNCDPEAGTDLYKVSDDLSTLLFKLKEQG